MARQTITKTNAPGNYPNLPISANAADIAWLQADTTNKEQFVSTGKEIVLAWNQGVGAATVTIESVADPFRREGDISAYSVGADEIAVFGPFPVEGWRQSDGKVYLEASSTDIRFAVIVLP
jgi:hypothetical protein